jgi:hypothetical protein
MGSLCAALRKDGIVPHGRALCKLVEEKAINWAVETVTKKVNNC